MPPTVHTIHDESGRATPSPEPDQGHCFIYLRGTKLGDRFADTPSRETTSFWDDFHNPIQIHFEGVEKAG